MVCIKNFTLPKTCEECKFLNDKSMDIISKITCKLSDCDLSDEESYTVSSTCPLIEI